MRTELFYDYILNMVKKEEIQPICEWELLEEKIFEEIETIACEGRRPGRPTVDQRISECTLPRVKQAILNLNAPYKIEYQIKQDNKLDWIKLEQIALKNEKSEPVWARAIVNVIRHVNSYTTPKIEKIKYEKWSSIDFCEYCWRQTPIGSKGKYVCDFHKNKSEYIRAYRSLPKLNKERRKIRKVVMNSFFYEDDMDINYPGWFIDLFPNLRQFIIKDLYSCKNKECIAELDKLVNFQKIMTGTVGKVTDKTIQILIAYLDDTSEYLNKRKKRHQEIFNNKSLLIEYLVTAESWLSIYAANIRRKGGIRKGAGRPRKNHPS